MTEAYSLLAIPASGGEGVGRGKWAPDVPGQQAAAPAAPAAPAAAAEASVAARRQRVEERGRRREPQISFFRNLIISRLTREVINFFKMGIFQWPQAQLCCQNCIFNHYLRAKF